MDKDNPAVTRQMTVSPAMLEALGRDPKMLTDIAKKMSLVQLDSLHRIAGNPNTPVGQKIQIAELTMKVADLFPRTSVANASAGVPFSVNIVFSNKAAPTAVTTLDAQTQEVISDGG